MYGVSSKFQRFLWVTFQLDDLCEAPSDFHVRQALSNLPSGLGETYRRILKKILRNPQKKYLALRIFQWVACARRPLEIKELQEAVAVDLDDKSWDGAKIPLEDTTIEACCGMVVRDPEDQTVRFAHHTVQQFLVLPAEDTKNKTTLHALSKDDEMQYFLFTKPQAEDIAARVCLTYLSFSDFETAVGHAERPALFSSGQLFGTEGPKSIPAVLGLRNPLLNISHRIFGPNTRGSLPSVAFQFTPHFGCDRPAVDITAKHSLLQYIIDHWAWHTKWFYPDSILQRRFRTLVLEKTLPFEFRPWGRNQHFGPYGCKSCPSFDEESGSSTKDLLIWRFTTGQQNPDTKI